MKPMMAGLRVFALLTVLSLLAGPVAPASSSGGQGLPPEAAGPGWHLATAAPVSPEAARRVRTVRAPNVPRAVAGLPASEAEAGPEIQALARALENDPGLIFDYVHNHVDYVPTFGSLNGATATLLAGRGNDWDQASLFIALMRAAGYSADYVVGDVTYPTARLANWLGVSYAGVSTVLANGGVPVAAVSGGYRITRAWVRASIGGQTYLFDPAMKVYSETTGIDLAGATGYSRAAFMARAQEGAVVAADLLHDMNESNVRADLATYSMNLVQYIETAMPDATLAQVVGGREIVATEMAVYPTALPYAAAVDNETVYTTLPEGFRHLLSVGLDPGIGIFHTFRTYEIAGRRVSIFFDAADGYRPSLRVDGTSVCSGNSTQPGRQYALALSIDHPYAASGGTYADQSDSTLLVSGFSYVIVHDFDTVSAGLLEARNRLLTGYVRDGYTDSSEPVLGEGLWLIGLTHNLEQYMYTALLSRVGRLVSFQHHKLGVMGQEEGYYMDLFMAHRSICPAAGGASTRAAFRAISMMSSALEHGVLEQLQGREREAVSTIKLLQMSNAAGDLIFLADSANWENVRSHLNGYQPAVLGLIESQVDDGYTIVLPENGALDLNQWHGVGFASYSDTGIHMLIGGGWYGGAVSWMVQVFVEGLMQALKELFADEDGRIELVIPQSDDPVDMLTGAFQYDSQDLVAGPSGLLDLVFRRTYNSDSHDALGVLGYGWGHNHQLSLAFHYDSSAGLGGRQPTDAAALITYAHVILNVLTYEDNLQGWMTAGLSTKWAMDQLIDNAITAHLGSTTAEYVRLPDGSYNPPPGIRQVLFRDGDYTYVQADGNTCLVFDADGRGRAWMDANGNSLIYTYDGAGRLQSVGSAALGQSLTLTYTGELLSAVADQAGRSVGFEYTGDQLTTFRDAENHTYRYGYDAAHRMVTLTRPLGNTVITNVYDDLGRVESQTDARGNTTTFYFGGFRAVEARPDGSRQVHYFNARSQAVGREDAAGNRASMSYDGQYRLRTQTDFLGGSVSYTYDPAGGQLATLVNGNGDTLAYSYAPQPHTFTNPFDGATITLTAYYQSRIDYPDGGHETFVYDTRGNLGARTDQAGETWGYQYNTRGQLTRATNPAGGRTDYTYNPNGTLASVDDSDSEAVVYGYDAYLRQDRMTYPGGTFVHTLYDLNGLLTALSDEWGRVSTYDYDANGNLRTASDPLGQLTTYTYDLLDQMLTRTDRRGQTTTYTYDTLNRLRSVTDPNGHTTQYDYDAHGWQRQIVDPASEVWQTAHDAEGALVSSATPLGYTTLYERDALGSLVATIDPLGYGTTLVRDALGRPTRETDAMGRSTRYTYDTRGLLAGVTLPGGEAVAYTYNALGALSAVRDLGGNTWGLDYTSMGRLRGHTDPLGGRWVYSYTQRGQVGQVVYPDGTGETRTYDAGGNLTRQQYSAGPDLHFAYDALNRLTAANGIGFAYDEEGLVTGTTDLVSGIGFGAAYDPGGRLETVTYAGGLFTVTYGYDARGLLTHAGDSLSGAAVQFAYDEDGRLVGVQRSNGVNATLDWDAASRLVRIRDGALLDLQYGYNAAGQVTQMLLDQPLDPSAYVVTDTLEFSFDAASQVSGSGYSYDAQGRLTGDPHHTYIWDAASRLIGIDDVALAYNGLGDVLTRTQGGQTTRYYYNYALHLNPIVAERSEDGAQFQRYYVWTPDGRLLYAIDAQDGPALSGVEANRVSFYHFDRLGSTLALSGEDGTLTDAYVYDPYGRLLHHQGSSTQPFTYVGQWGVRQAGPATGPGAGTLYHMRARYYDAVTSRFISREPLWPRISRPQAVNPYQYALQDPLNYLDPTGSQEESAGDILLQTTGDVLVGQGAACTRNLIFWNKMSPWLQKTHVAGILIGGAAAYAQLGRYALLDESARADAYRKTPWWNLGGAVGEWWYGVDYEHALWELQQSQAQAQWEAEQKAYWEQREQEWGEYREEMEEFHRELALRPLVEQIRQENQAEQQAREEYAWLEMWLGEYGMSLHLTFTGKNSSYRKALPLIYQIMFSAASR